MRFIKIICPSLIMLFLFCSCTNVYVPQAVPLSEIQGIPPSVLKLAIKAYDNAACQGLVEKPYLTIIDFQKPSNEKRLWTINMKTKQLLFYTYVAHGKDSGKRYATHFSNRINSLESSIGVIKTENAYEGSIGYSMKLAGLEQGINNNIFVRLIVFHSATYASPDYIQQHGYAGNTWGCFAVPPNLNGPIINTIKNGSIIVAYYPNKAWLKHSAFLHNTRCKHR